MIMKNIKFLISLLVIWLFSITSLSAEYTTTSSSNGYNTAITDNSLNFKAELIDGKVHTSWTAYDNSDSFKWYKVVRSTKKSNPVYPDDGYIKYYWEVNSTEYIDSKPPVGLNYYRVCAITHEKNRYCSNVVKVNIEKTEMAICTMEYAPVCGKKDGKYKTYSNKCMLKSSSATYKYYGECKDQTTNSTWLNYKLKNKADIIVKKFVYKIDKKDINNSDKAKILNKVIDRLNSLKDSKPKLEEIIWYLVEKLNEQVSKYDDDFSDIESIFGEY